MVKTSYVLEKIETDKKKNAYYTRVVFDNKESRDNYLEQSKKKSSDVFYTKYNTESKVVPVLSRNLEKENK